jgi:hypothetical protein
MGWDYTRAITPVDRAGECRAMVSPSKTVIRDAVVGTTWYAAIQDNNTKEVHAAVVLTSVNNREYDNFGTKWMTEYDGPYQYDCPEAILKLLSPTTSDFANEWRRKCREKRAAKRRGEGRKDILRTAPYGTRLRVGLSDGTERTVVKMKPGRKFKTWWLLVEHDYKYIPKRYVVSAVPA